MITREVNQFNKEEALLVRRAARGEEAAFSEIVLRYTRMVYNIAYRYTQNTEDASDVSQEVFLRAWRSLSAFRGESTLSTWLCRIAMNCAVDFMRQARRHATLSTTAEEEDGRETLDIADRDEDSPEEALLRADAREAVRRAIDQLPPEGREVIVLRDINGLSYTEIAAVLDLEMGTVKSRLSRARAHIKKTLTDGNFFP